MLIKTAQSEILILRLKHLLASISDPVFNLFVSDVLSIYVLTFF